MNAKSFVRDVSTLNRALVMCVSILLYLYFVDSLHVFEDFLASVQTTYSSIGSRFGLIEQGAPIWDLFLLFLVTMTFVTFVFLFGSTTPRWLRLLAVLYTFVLHTLYISFRLTTLNLHDVASALASGMLFSTEALHYLMMCCFYLNMAWPIDRVVQTDRYEDDIRQGRYVPSVAIFVPTYDEPSDLLRRTLIGCQALDYPLKSVYLLDDTGRPEIERLANELGCRYIARDDNRHAKSGNLNNALAHTSEELIAFFDCDNVPSRNFLQRLAGFFQDPEVAMVISSLHYFNARNPGKNIGIEMLIAADHARALSSSQAGRDTFNALLCFGTSYIVRRDALNEIGGIPTETLCEDWATSIKLQAKGYKTCFVDEVLSSGIAAENLTEFISQRLRWCQGTLQSLFATSNPLKIQGLDSMQRIVHFFGVLYYLMYPATLVALFVPLLYFFFGIVPIDATISQFAVYFMPYFLMQGALYVMLSRRVSSLISSQVSDYIMCFPLSWVVARTLIKPFGRRFRVTRKGFISSEIVPMRLVGYPMLFMFFLYMSGIFFAEENAFWSGVEAPFIIYFLWAVYRMFFLWMAYHASVDLPQKRQASRFDHVLGCEIFDEHGRHFTSGQTKNVSDRGLEIVVEGGRIPPRGLISIPELALENVAIRAARVVRETGSFGVEFSDLTMEQQFRITEFIYCRPGRWNEKTTSERSTFRSLSKFLTGVGP